MSAAPPADDRPLFRSRELWWKVGLSLVVALACVWLLRAGALPVVPAEGELGLLDWTLAAVAALCWTGMHVVRTLRWQLLVASVAEVPRLRVWGVALLGFAAAVVFPLRTGEAVRPVLLGRAGASPWAAAGTVAAERVVDGAFISSALLLCLKLAPPREPLPMRLGELPVNVALVPQGASLAAAVFVAAFVALVLFYRFRALSRRAVYALVAPLSPRFAEAVTVRLDQVTRGFGFLANVRVSLPFGALTLVYWSLNAAGLWLLARGAGFSMLSPFGAFAAAGVMAVGITLPSAPGLFGSYQLGLYAGLLLYIPVNSVTTAGAAVVFVMYVTQIGVHLLGGLAGWALLAFEARRTGAAVP